MLFHGLKFSGLLSFGRDGVDLPLQSLNVLIGPNGSGKSNLLEAISLFQAAPVALTDPISRTGGLREWLWKGAEPSRDIVMEAAVDFAPGGVLRHSLTLTDLNGRAVVADEQVEPSRARRGIVDLQCPVTGGTVSLFLEERGNRSIPASRLSDGTLRYLSLLAVLLHPEPPPLTCIEEPELGLHPDLLPTLADLMIAASERSQLVVTTHSDVLVDALTDRPESVIVCEKQDGLTEMRRLDRAQPAPRCRPAAARRRREDPM